MEAGMSMTVLKQQWDRAEAIWGREEANKLFGNQLNANTDGRVGALGASVGGVVDGCAGGGVEGMSGTFDFGRSADHLNCGVGGGERCEMFSILMESNARLQEEYLELKEELKAWKGDVLSSLNAGFVDSLSKIGNKVTHELDRHSQQVKGLVENSINSIGSAIFKSVTGVVEQSISGIGVKICEGLLEDIEACVDRSTRKVQEDMKTINEKDWGEFREEIVRNFEKINCDKKCHDLLVSSGEKHGGEGTGVHMNGEQLSNAGGGVSGGQAEIGTHLESAKCAGLSGRGAVLGVRCVGAQEGYVRSNREFNRPRSNCAGRQLNNNYFWRDQRSFHGQQRVGYKREHWRERKFIRCYVCNRAGHIAYYCHKRHLGSWPQRGESRVVHDAGVGTEEEISGGKQRGHF